GNRVGSRGLGGALYVSNFTSVSLSNCILWGDSSPEIIRESQTAIATLTHSDVQGNSATPDAPDASGNFGADPLFVRNPNPAATVPDYGDLHLQPGSPCIDKGDNSAVPAGLHADLDGNQRIANGGVSLTVDLGVYELGASPYVNQPPVANAGGD